MSIRASAAALVCCSFLSLAAPAAAVSIDLVAIGDPGNAGDTTPATCGPGNSASCGDVASSFYMAKYEVTNAQYAEFLNAVADADTNSLYLTSMSGTISRSGVSGSYVYAVVGSNGSKPIPYVTFWSAARFSNWLHNGQPTGAQSSLTTEDGAYTLTAAAISTNSVVRNAGALYWIPSEDEWYKAAYYDPGTASYFDYPTGSNTAPTCSTPTATANRENCSGGPGAPTDVGAYTGSPSPYGTFDQSGNVSEWTDSIVGSMREARGSAFNATTFYDYAGTPSAVAATYSASNHGFRVGASIPEPGTALLVTVGLLGLSAGVRRAPRKTRPRR
jgi:formylglycine-generating enzyme required for sulfatase activity